MKDAKNIDAVFQKKLQNIEVQPDPKVWQQIENRIQQKKRKVLPMWWLSSGIAALLVLGIFLYPFSKNKDTTILEDIDYPKEILKTTEKKPTNTLELNKNQEVTNTDPSIKEQTKPIKKVEKTQHFSLVDKKVAQQEKEPSNSRQKKGIPGLEKIVHEPSVVINQETKNTDDKVAMKKNSLSKESKNKTEEKKKLFAQIPEENEEEKDTKKNRLKWEVSPTVGVLKANSFTQSSALDVNLNNNPVSGENTVTYGVRVGYQLNDKWTIQSGIHIQNVAFNTSNVAIAQSLTASSNLENVNFTTDNLLFGNSSEGIATNDAFSIPITENGVINQAYGYIEIPIEVKYKVFSTQKFNTQLVSGFSTLILNKNEITSSAENFSQVLGEATNLNPTNFSGNLGLDLNYEINTNWSINLNPMFKTQFSTFSNNANDFKPYFIGVYSGIKYKF